MSLLESFSASSVVHVIGWTLVHFLWQGALLGVAVAIALGALRRSGARARYVALCAASCTGLILPVATFLYLLTGPRDALAAASLLPLSSGGPGWLLDGIPTALPAVTLIWGVCTLFLQARTGLQLIRATRLGSTSVRPLSGHWPQTIEELKLSVGVSRPVQVLESALATVPMVIGWLRPVILVPSAALAGLSVEQLRAVLAHELAHVRRHDYFVNLIQTVVEGLLFFHPVIWWVSHRIRVERELCCDDVAVAVSGDTLRYVQALSNLETLRSGSVEPAVASNGGSLMHRISRLVGVEARTVHQRRNWLSPLVLGTTVVLALSSAGLALATAPAEGEKEVQVRLNDVVPHLDQNHRKIVHKLLEHGVKEQTILVVLAEIGADRELAAGYTRARHRQKMHEKLRGRIIEFQGEGQVDLTVEDLLGNERLPGALVEVAPLPEPHGQQRVDVWLEHDPAVHGELELVPEDGTAVRFLPHENVTLELLPGAEDIQFDATTDGWLEEVPQPPADLRFDHRVKNVPFGHELHEVDVIEEVPAPDASRRHLPSGVQGGVGIGAEQPDFRRARLPQDGAGRAPRGADFTRPALPRAPAPVLPRAARPTAPDRPLPLPAVNKPKSKPPITDL